MRDQERAKRNRPSLWLLLIVLIPTVLLLNRVLGLSVNWSFFIALAVTVAVNVAVKRPWRDADDDWPGRRDR
jgi:hypothetical protein